MINADIIQATPDQIKQLFNTGEGMWDMMAFNDEIELDNWLSTSDLIMVFRCDNRTYEVYFDGNSEANILGRHDFDCDDWQLFTQDGFQMAAEIVGWAIK